MQNTNQLLPLVQYQLLWVVMGASLLFLIIVWFVIVMIMTRKRKQKTIANLPIKEVVLPDIEGLKKKYLQLIDKLEERVETKKLTIRLAHQTLSLLVRFFVFEVSGFHAQVLTLKDLKQSRFPVLAEAIEKYYPDEFDEIIKGSSSDAFNRARNMVTKWN